jgi:hypothetical protein
MMLLELQAKYASLKRQADNSAEGQHIETPTTASDNPNPGHKENPTQAPAQRSSIEEKKAAEERAAEGVDTEAQQLRRENALLRDRIQQIRGVVPGGPAIQQRPDSFQPWLLPLIMLAMLLSFISGIAFKNYRIARRARQSGTAV